MRVPGRARRRRGRLRHGAALLEHVTAGLAPVLVGGHGNGLYEARATARRTVLRCARRVAAIETDYLVVGAGAAGMAFTDSLIEHSDAEVVMVDRRHRPGGHWNDAYPFARLHQPSAYYGVSSRPLCSDAVDRYGPNAGFYERATADEICAYFERVLEEQLLPSGRVQFSPMCDYRPGVGGRHRFASLLTGEEHEVTVRRKVVDATYLESPVPRRTPRPSTSSPVWDSYRSTTSCTSGRRARATSSSVRARPRWTRASGCSTTASTPAPSDG